MEPHYGIHKKGWEGVCVTERHKKSQNDTESFYVLSFDK